MWDVDERLERVHVEVSAAGDVWVSLTGAEGGRVDLPGHALFGAADALRDLVLTHTALRVKDGGDSSWRTTLDLPHDGA